MAKKYYALDKIVFEEKPRHHGFVDIEGKKFGHLLVLGVAGKINSKLLWYCQCDCGNIIQVKGNSIKTGNTSSCGCLSLDLLKQRNISHGKSELAEYLIYKGMKNRCQNNADKSYPNYGGRGIKVLLSFEDFLEEVGFRPSPKHSIERIENNKNYEKGNIRWATYHEQANNRRSNKIIECNGVSKTVAEWAKVLDVPSPTLFSRKNNGWCDFHTISLPVHSERSKDCPKCIFVSQKQ